MSGQITVANPNDWQDVPVTVTDTVDVGGGADCTVADGETVVPVAAASPSTTRARSRASRPTTAPTRPPSPGMRGRHTRRRPPPPAPPT
ncbi:hypothetical protein G7085_08595 [Tessaracoccus sp. HDW20]|uniref:hypothetical protein n=1 Tax=Tessaracoccus coleopterorum TaxID=2714950 RepID=UPI0018D4BC25|nr:hypothetical protein [Tessaracoccus coleopterorum]NHB84649.1 hypothetical protein [Tessaracoccus coleopterorum]